MLLLGKRDSNTHCLTMDVFAIFQLVGFDRRQACLHPAALKSCEKHLIGRCEQFNIRDFCRYKENTAENTCRIFKVFDAITAKISMLNQCGFDSLLPILNKHIYSAQGLFILRLPIQIIIPCSVLPQQPHYSTSINLCSAKCAFPSFMSFTIFSK